MKKNFYYIFLCLLVTFSFVNVVVAVDELKFSAFATVSDTKVTKGKEATVTVSLKSDDSIAACLFKVENDENIEFVSKKTLINNWVVSETGVNGFSVEDISLSGVSMSKGMAVLSLTYRINGNGKVTVKVDNCASLDDKVGYYNEDIVINFEAIEPADDTNLSSINVTKGGQLTTSFAPNNYDNNVIVLTSRNFSLSLTASNSDYQGDIVVTREDGAVLNPESIDFFDPSNQGMMLLYVTVKNKTTYNLMARYEAGLDNSLKFLKVNGQNVSLESGKDDYKLHVDSNVTSVTIEAELADNTNFKFGNNFDGKTIHNFSGSSTVYPIVIEPINSEIGGMGRTYRIEIVKKNNSSGNTSSKPSSSSSSQNNNVATNPSTGGISMFFMLIVLMASLIGSVYLYRKNNDNYE